MGGGDGGGRRCVEGGGKKSKTAQPREGLRRLLEFDSGKGPEDVDQRMAAEVRSRIQV
jgi:hypothetical protein